jgi:ADP-heptose:LPS heptosyltransferase
MRLLDEHWIAYPQLIAGELRWLERFKIKRLGRPTIRYLDVILSRNTPEEDSMAARVGLKRGGYLLIVPGGGTGHPGANDAAEQFLAAANALAETETVVFVGPTKAADAGEPARAKSASSGLPSSRLRCFSSLPQADLADLMSHARLVVTNGGSTLLQAIACGCACIAVPIARDQPKRIQDCVAAGVAVAADLSAASILRAAGKLLHDEPARTALGQRAANLKLANGVEIALNALAHLAETA